MGLLDRMIKNVANDVLGDALRQVERNASNAISGKVTALVDDYSEVAKAKVENKKEDMKQAIIEASENQKLPEIVANSEESEALQFGSTEKVVYHYVDEDKQIDDFVPLRVIGSMILPIGENGKYEGNQEVADKLSDGIFESLQKVLDELTAKSIEPNNLSSRGITLSQKTRQYVEPLCNQYKLSAGMVVFSIILPVNETAYTDGENVSGQSAWVCPYCGSKATGNVCGACGAPKEV